MSITRFKNLHKGETGIILCGGSDINNWDVSKFNDSVVFVMNRGYLLAKRGLDVENSYFVSIDELIQRQFKSEFFQLKCKAKFANRIGKSANIYNMRWTGDIPKFSTDISKPFWQGHSVTNTAIQIAFYMGCDPVYIVGMNHTISYKHGIDRGKGEFEVREQAGDKNHFDPNYHPQGTLFHSQNLNMVALGYRLASEAFKAHGRKLYNLSIDTELSEEDMLRFKKPEWLLNEEI